ncbi:ATP-dependent RNA helicase HrpA [Nymphon striatum]|nr:ATP-dependent RNA helicase HrpA [Nymphon striatum]
MISTIWGLAGVVLFPDDLIYQVLLIMILFSVLFAAIPTLAASRIAYYLQILVTLAPTTILLILSPDHGHDLLAISMIVMAITLVLVSSYIYHLLYELQRAQFALQDLADTDQLTQVANRRHFDRKFKTEWRRAMRERTPISLLLLDVDFFKKYNDSLGHQAGDECLRKISASLRSVTRRPADLAARYGGEEFAVLLPVTKLEDARMLAERLRTKIENLRIEHPLSESGVVTVSIGVSCCEPGWDFTGDTPEEEQDVIFPAMLVTAADNAMYVAKRQGRNRVSEQGCGDHKIRQIHTLEKKLKAQSSCAQKKSTVGSSDKSHDKSHLEKEFQKLQSKINASIKKRTERLQKLPTPEYPDSLPVAERREEIIKTIAENQVTIICGETGSGKTTQLPKMCLELGRGVDGYIGHTQPRRLAARSVAARIAEELKTELGAVVGYKVRFHDQTRDDSYVKLMTDDVKDLKVIITSATIDPQRFAKHFSFGGKDAPIIEVSGRTYPVEIRYHSLIPDKKKAEEDQEEEKEKDMLQAIVDASDELMQEAPGGILVFLSGEREIREASEALRKHHKPSVEILPLFARLSAAEQNKIFHPTGARRIVLATNVAETSLTVPGIKYVIDTGLARISRYSWRSRVQRLPIEKVSQASANQRSGRCGRTSDGIAIRLYAEDDFESRAEFTLPEIQRTNLASVILQLASLNLGDVYKFPYIEAPDAGMIRDGYKLLFELGAVNKASGENIKITPIGRQLAGLPTDPRLGRMLLAARDQGVPEEVLVIVSALSIQDVRERPMDKQQASDQKHSRFKDETSDFISLLRLWDYYH